MPAFRDRLEACPPFARLRPPEKWRDLLGIRARVAQGGPAASRTVAVPRERG